MKILVTGGLGVIGKILCKELLKRNHEVISCDIYHDTNEISFSISSDISNPNYVRCDVGEFRQIERIFNQMGPFDFVYHCAAEVGRWSGEDFYENLWRTNAVGTKNIIRLQERLKFKMIFCSSSEIYGNWPDLMVENITDKYAIPQLNDYAMSKWVNEMQIRNSNSQHGTETVVVRLFNTYGPGEYYTPYRSVNCRFLYCALHGIPWTVYRGYHRTSTYLMDTITTLSNIVDNFKSGETYNIGGGKNQQHSIEELSDIILKITGVDQKLVQYKESEILTIRDKKVDISKSIRDLNHVNKYDLETGIKLTTKWMQDVYKHSIKKGKF